MINKLLIPYDGSDAARAAFELGFDLAGKYDAELHILAVARPDGTGGIADAATLEHHRNVLEELKTRIDGVEGVRFEARLGQPAETIVAYAEAHAVDHIVLGHRGHGVLDRWLPGSVAHWVVAEAPCAVTVVKVRHG